ncbi:PLP-dependent aminotransferase family protein [Paenibacillus sp. CN-4]|uniref:aminotransferase-like domain-containing protein n=1 Tax=Paenibacillus nanchangensis TaxID=3348343 RepID=UPI003979090A
MEIMLPYDEYLKRHRYKYLALYHALRSAILEGRLAGGTRLPSTRRMAGLYGLSRGSASQVYEMLLADGYIRAEIGRGTFVAEVVPASPSAVRPPLIPPGSRAGEEPLPSGALSAPGKVRSGSGEAASGQLADGEDGTGWMADGGDSAAAARAWSTADAEDNGLVNEAGRVMDGAERTGSEKDGQGVSGLPLSDWARRLLLHPDPRTAPGARMPGFISFTGGAAPMEHFPYTEWRSALSYAGGRSGARLGAAAPPEGDEALRQSLAAYLGVTRGIRTGADSIVLFSGSMQGLVLLTQLLLKQGERAVLEEPGFHGIRRAIEVTGGIPVPAPVDALGLVPEDWDARLLFVTPSRQFPTGAVLPLERRRRLLEWAHRRGAVIVEDDYDSEFRWAGRPIEPLKALDSEGRVVYIGSFTGSLFAGLRLGYAVLPPALVRPAVMAKALYEPMTAGQLEQRALARFMSMGGYARHLRRMKRIYGERAKLFRSLMEERLGSVLRLRPADAGLQAYAEWLGPEGTYKAFRGAAVRRGADFRDAALYRMQAGPPAGCFSFSHLSPEQLKEGVDRLAAAWDDVQKSR